GRDAITVPVAPAPSIEATPRDAPHEPAPNLPAQPLAAALASLPGTLDGVDNGRDSRGPGSGPGAGNGVGSGLGGGTGPGLNDGTGGGVGGEIFQPGSGVAMPVPVYEAKPQYTADAMRARVQGSVFVQCAVQITGQCTNLRVVRSLDRDFGL